VPEVYVSTDVEADGPIPGPHSMLSLGSAAYLPDGTLVDTFSVNLATLEGASGHPDTMAWWRERPDAWAAARTDPQDVTGAMHRYARWARGLPGRPVFVAYPVGFDFTFVHWYLLRFTGEDPFGHSALDVRTYAMALLGVEYGMAGMRNVPQRWLGEVRSTHVALDDALEQGALFCAMLKEAGERRSG